MKKAIVILLSLSTFVGFSQLDLSTDLIGIAFSNYNIGAEYGLNTTNSVGVNVAFGNDVPLEKSENDFGSISFSQVNIVPEYKYFMSNEKGNDGIYFGTYARYRSSNTKDVIFVQNSDPTTELKTDVSTTAFSLGLLTGYKWKSSGKVFFEITGGIGKFLTNNISTSNALINDDNETSFDPKLSTPFNAGENLPDFRLMGKIGLRF